jgi:hypothetical protein
VNKDREGRGEAGGVAGDPAAEIKRLHAEVAALRMGLRSRETSLAAG